MTWVGIDDTDGPDGGCTTFVLTEILRAAQEMGFDPIGHPRLVRLNPNVPWKTRGNAALGLRLGHGRGPTHPVARLPEGDVLGFARGASLQPAEQARLFEELWRVVEGACGSGDPSPDPALVVSSHRLPAALYWTTVGREVVPADVERLLAREDAMTRAGGDGRGIVGAAAAIAWPASRPTWEIIAYRPRARWGTKRKVDPNSVQRLARTIPETFLSFDADRDRMLVSPHTPCPILYGVRATRPERLPEVMRTIRSEPVERWCLFVTNQGTGDHVRRRRIGDLRPYDAALLEGEVVERPTVGAGGHWKFRLREPAGATIECIAFEPTKNLPRVVRELVAGDRLRVWGGLGAEGPFRLEGIVIRHLAPRRVNGSNPRCPRCDRATHSAGRTRGFRCLHCHVRVPPERRAVLRAPTVLERRRYDPVPSGRRHLHPLAPERARDVTPWRAVVARPSRTDL